jgi:hypothetical protein
VGPIVASCPSRRQGPDSPVLAAKDQGRDGVELVRSPVAAPALSNGAWGSAQWKAPPVALNARRTFQGAHCFGSVHDEADGYRARRPCDAQTIGHDRIG